MLCTATLLVAAPNVLETESRLQNLLHQISVLVTAENAKYYERMDTSVSTANKPTGSKTSNFDGKHWLECSECLGRTHVHCEELHGFSQASSLYIDFKGGKEILYLCPRCRGDCDAESEEIGSVTIARLLEDEQPTALNNGKGEWGSQYCPSTSSSHSISESNKPSSLSISTSSPPKHLQKQLLDTQRLFLAQLIRNKGLQGVLFRNHYKISANENDNEADDYHTLDPHFAAGTPPRKEEEDDESREHGSDFARASGARFNANSNVLDTKSFPSKRKFVPINRSDSSSSLSDDSSVESSIHSSNTELSPSYFPLSRKRLRSSPFGEFQEPRSEIPTKAMKTSNSTSLEFSQITTTSGDLLQTYGSSSSSSSSSSTSIPLQPGLTKIPSRNSKENGNSCRQPSMRNRRSHSSGLINPTLSPSSHTERLFLTYAPTGGDCRKPRVERKGNGVVKIIL
eukprot:jgi/Bigna1/86757/estExt_fgenesh1_pg.C_130183